MTHSACGANPTVRGLSAAAAMLVLLAALLWPTPAAASDTGTWTDLQSALNSCGGTSEDPTTVTLTGDITPSDGTLTVACVAELDLNGHALTVANVVINAGQQFTINDGPGGGGTLTAGPGGSGTAGIRTTGATLVVQSGTVVATGGHASAGIGGGNGSAGGQVDVSGGTVHANGGLWAAGIGGGDSAAGGTVSISSGTVTAIGGGDGAGIGGGMNGAGGTVTISGGDVEAKAGNHAAGIGSGLGGIGGQVDISGGTVTATGGNWGAGIGNGYGFNRASGTVDVSGGTVSATGGTNAAGIGGGYYAFGAQVNVGVDAVVTATGGYTAVGAGQGSSSFGSLTVAGTLRLPADNLVIPTGAEVSVAGTGKILGGTDPTVGATVVGGGRIANQGVIALRSPLVTGSGVTVSGDHYRVAFDAAGGSPTPDDVVVFASSFEAGHRAFPAHPTRDDGQAFNGWTTEPDGAGDPFTATSLLPGTSDGATPVDMTVFANWTIVSLDTGLTDDEVTITAGDSTTFTPALTDSNDQPFAGDPASWTINDADGLVDATIDEGAGQITLTSTTVGTYPLELHIPAANLTTTITLHVEAAAMSVLNLDVAGTTTVIQGDTVTITVTGTDEHGNPTGDITDQITFTSDVATDVIDGNTITFPTASPHTITATHTSGATAAIIFEITPAATDDDTSAGDQTSTGDGTPDDETSAGDDPSTGDGTPDDETSIDDEAPIAEVTHPTEGSLPDTGTNPLGLLTAALLMAMAGTLLLRRSATGHHHSPVTPVA